MLKLISFLSLFFCVSAFAEAGTNNPANSIKPEQVVVVVNKQDPNSLVVGDYYLTARNIPKKNLIVVDVAPDADKISEEQFKDLREQIYANMADEIQVIVLAWAKPYAVNCNSITSAVTLGYEPKQCENGCATGVKNPYFNSPSRNPQKDFNMRLSILLPTYSVDLAKAVIDKGVLSTFKLNQATAYFLKTNDESRSKPREAFFPKDLTRVESKQLYVRTIKAESIKNKKDIMFYFTGTASVPYLETLNFMPGAVADHLTSFGGELYGDGQMSIIKWLEAGATGSYGSVSEPCNYWQKFPNPAVMVSHYLAGESLIESYWKSVYWPTQGLFVGEPLARPYYVEPNFVDLNLINPSESQ
ncbi:MAG: TIGR03790 family protein [Methylotenera sp.]|nr:MAG: TIGR03790 family protein [Methylotenera sp.]